MVAINQQGNCFGRGKLNESTEFRIFRNRLEATKIAVAGVSAAERARLKSALLFHRKRIGLDPNGNRISGPKVSFRWPTRLGQLIPTVLKLRGIKTGSCE